MLSLKTRELLAKTGIVVIARNEGERLRRCIASLQRGDARAVRRIVYVDSGSTDGSVAFARSQGLPVVELEGPDFTMARARNAGFDYLMELHAEIRFVQFIDGDCELDPAWLGHAVQHITQDAISGPAIVCGNRRERYPERSVYNRYIDREWQRPAGAAEACGGDFLIHAGVFASLGGFRESLICGEEPEMCLRLQSEDEAEDLQARFRVLRLDRAMTVHDAAIHRFGQWWQRSVRGGWAWAEGSWMHGRRTGYRLRECLRTILYGATLPVGALAAGIAAILAPTSLVQAICLGAAGLAVSAYGVLYLRLLWRLRREGVGGGDALRFALMLVLEKFAGMQGMLALLRQRLRGKRATLIEYKQSASAARPQPGRRLRAAVIGVGGIAAEHLAYLRGSEHALLCAVCDLSPAAAGAAAVRYGAARSYQDPAVMLADARPDIVHILTPPGTHGDLARLCLEAGVHVVVEKPIVLDYAELIELQQLARRRGLALLENHNYRWNPDFVAIENAMLDGRIGTPVDVEIRLDLALRESSGRYSDTSLPHPSHNLPAGVVHEFLTHLAYLALRFVPADPRIEFARLSNLHGSRDAQSEDVFRFDDLEVLLSARQADGRMVRARLRFCAVSAPAGFRIIVRGTDGQATTDLFHPCALISDASSMGGLGPIRRMWQQGLTLLRAAGANLRGKLRGETPYSGLYNFLEQNYAALVRGALPAQSAQEVQAAARLQADILRVAGVSATQDRQIKKYRKATRAGELAA